MTIESTTMEIREIVHFCPECGGVIRHEFIGESTLLTPEQQSRQALACCVRWSRRLERLVA
jgi:hypothetical protein